MKTLKLDNFKKARKIRKDEKVLASISITTTLGKIVLYHSSISFNETVYATIKFLEDNYYCGWLLNIKDVDDLNMFTNYMIRCLGGWFPNIIISDEEIPRSLNIDINIGNDNMCDIDDFIITINTPNLTLSNGLGVMYDNLSQFGY